MKTIRKYLAFPFVVVGVVVLAAGLLIAVGLSRSTKVITVMTDAVKSLEKE